MKQIFKPQNRIRVCVITCSLLALSAVIMCWPKSSHSRGYSALGWSHEFNPDPSFSKLIDIREWSPHEIALRHRNVLGKELPKYVTELRGFGAITETVDSVPRWFFVIPMENIPDFQDYLVAIGLPRAGLYKRDGKEKFPPPYDDKIWDPPAPVRFSKLFYADTQAYETDEDSFGMRFGPSSSSYLYKFYSPNTAFWVIMCVGWESGNVRVSLGDVRRKSD